MVDRFLRRLVTAILTGGCVVLIGLGIPSLWFWIGGAIGGRYVPGWYISPRTFLAILPGMIVTYLVLISLFGRWLRSRQSEEELREQAWPVRRASWNRSMREQRYRPGQMRMAPVELAFVLAASALSVAFTIWFLFYAETG